MVCLFTVKTFSICLLQMCNASTPCSFSPLFLRASRVKNGVLFCHDRCISVICGLFILVPSGFSLLHGYSFRFSHLTDCPDVLHLCLWEFLYLCFLVSLELWTSVICVLTWELVFLDSVFLDHFLLPTRLIAIVWLLPPLRAGSPNQILHIFQVQLELLGYSAVHLF